MPTYLALSVKQFHRRQTAMKDEKKSTTLITLKSALKKATLSAILVGGLLAPTAQAVDLSATRQPLEQRVKIVGEALREKLSKSQNLTDAAQAETAKDEDGLLAQWGNWGNWGNWNNWRNWLNWNNWGNWGNWGNY